MCNSIFLLQIQLPPPLFKSFSVNMTSIMTIPKVLSDFVSTLTQVVTGKPPQATNYDCVFEEYDGDSVLVCAAPPPTRHFTKTNVNQHELNLALANL